MKFVKLTVYRKITFCANINFVGFEKCAQKLLKAVWDIIRKYYRNQIGGISRPCRAPVGITPDKLRKEPCSYGARLLISVFTPKGVGLQTQRSFPSRGR